MRIKRLTILLLLLCGVCLVSSAQLVTKRDYTAAIALQAGGNVSMFVPGSSLKPGISPVGGLKFTIPFTRKWFLGAEANYTEVKGKYQETYDYSTSMEIDVRLSEIQVPVYLKYMINSNKESILFGGYFSRTFDHRVDLSAPNVDIASSDLSHQWGGGITIGYERRLARSLNLMARASAGINNTSSDLPGSKVYPIQLSIMLSYDLFRIGDCHCD